MNKFAWLLLGLNSIYTLGYIWHQSLCIYYTQVLTEKKIMHDEWSNKVKSIEAENALHMNLQKIKSYAKEKNFSEIKKNNSITIIKK